MRWTKSGLDLGRRTPGEELWLARKAAGWTQVDAAREAGVPRDAYVDVEAGRKPVSKAVRRAVGRVRPDLPALLALARRRSGIGLGGLAAALSVSRVTVLAAERRGDPALVRFWHKRGYRFS